MKKIFTFVTFVTVFVVWFWIVFTDSLKYKNNEFRNELPTIISWKYSSEITELIIRYIREGSKTGLFDPDSLAQEFETITRNY